MLDFLERVTCISLVPYGGRCRVGGLPVNRLAGQVWLRHPYKGVISSGLIGDEYFNVLRLRVWPTNNKDQDGKAGVAEGA